MAGRNVAAPGKTDSQPGIPAGPVAQRPLRSHARRTGPTTGTWSDAGRIRFPEVRRFVGRRPRLHAGHAILGQIDRSTGRQACSTCAPTCAMAAPSCVTISTSKKVTFSAPLAATTGASASRSIRTWFAPPGRNSGATRSRPSLPKPATDQRPMPGIMPFMPRMSLPMPPLDIIFIIFCDCSN